MLIQHMYAFIYLLLNTKTKIFRSIFFRLALLHITILYGLKIRFILVKKCFSIFRQLFSVLPGDST